MYYDLLMGTMDTDLLERFKIPFQSSTENILICRETRLYVPLVWHLFDPQLFLSLVLEYSGQAVTKKWQASSQNIH